MSWSFYFKGPKTEALAALEQATGPSSDPAAPENEQFNAAKAFIRHEIEATPDPDEKSPARVLDIACYGHHSTWPMDRNVQIKITPATP